MLRIFPTALSLPRISSGPSTSSLLLSAFLLASTAAQAAIPTNVTPRNFFTALTFNRPVHVAAVPGRDSAFVVLEQWLAAGTSGQMTYVSYQGGAWTKTVFDTAMFSGAGGVTSNREMGLIGFAFHPDFAQNRKYYLTYTSNYSSSATPPARTFVAERRAASTGASRDASVASRILLNIPQSGNSEEGGHLAFGADGFLYVAVGDGGNAAAAQHADSLRGKILRIDVNAADAGKEYAVPADNPFAGQSGKKGEVWASGLRNPWRFAFHPVRHELWVGDVGADDEDEVSLAAKGANLGWSVREGTLCVGGGTSCASTGLTAPLVTRGAQSLIGGVHFMGQSSGQFHDTYIYGNSGQGQVWALRYGNGAVLDAPTQIATLANVSSFGLDARGRVLATRLGTSGMGGSITANTGVVQVLESPDMVLAAPSSLARARGARALPNLSRAEVLRDRNAYVVQSLDGREVKGTPQGVFFVFRKEDPSNARAVSWLW